MNRSSSSASTRARAPLPLATVLPALLGAAYARLALALPEERVPDVYRDPALALCCLPGAQVSARLLVDPHGPAPLLALIGGALADALVPESLLTAWLDLELPTDEDAADAADAAADG